MGTSTSKELQVKPDDFIVTKTDIRGKITYCNDAFMEYSGFYEEELIGNDHDLIRHNDMPESIFQLMRETLQQENEFLGFIKNRRKNGGAFWTFINVTPSFDLNNKVLGYFSVHRSPSPEGIEFFAPIYEQMRELESNGNNKQGIEASMSVLMNAISNSGDYNEHVCSYYK